MIDTRLVLVPPPSMSESEAVNFCPAMTLAGTARVADMETAIYVAPIWTAATVIVAAVAVAVVPSLNESRAATS